MLTAMCSAFEPSSVMNHSAPCSTSAFAHSVWPLESATCRGAYPSRSRSFASTSSSSSSDPASCASVTSRVEGGRRRMGSIVVRGEGFFLVKPLFRRFTDGRRDDDRGIGREGGARRTGLKSPSLLSLDRSLTISSTSPTSAASCSGLRFGEGVRGRVSGARAGRSRMSFARREHSTRRRWKSGDPGGIGPSRAYREARALTRHRHRRRRRSRTSCETLGARQGSPRRNAPSLFVGNTGSIPYLFRRQRHRALQNAVFRRFLQTPFYMFS